MNTEMAPNFIDCFLFHEKKLMAHLTVIDERLKLVIR